MLITWRRGGVVVRKSGFHLDDRKIRGSVIKEILYLKLLALNSEKR